MISRSSCLMRCWSAKAQSYTSPQRALYASQSPILSTTSVEYTTSKSLIQSAGRRKFLLRKGSADDMVKEVGIVALDVWMALLISFRVCIGSFKTVSVVCSFAWIPSNRLHRSLPRPHPKSCSSSSPKKATPPNDFSYVANGHGPWIPVAGEPLTKSLRDLSGNYKRYACLVKEAIRLWLVLVNCLPVLYLGNTCPGRPAIPCFVQRRFCNQNEMLDPSVWITWPGTKHLQRQAKGGLLLWLSWLCSS